MINMIEKIRMTITVTEENSSNNNNNKQSGNTNFKMEVVYTI